MRRVVVVGGAAAGLASAEALRRQGFTGEITVVSDEPGSAYDRPPLSKQLLAGEWPEEKAILFPASRVERMGADLRLGKRATGVDLEKRLVYLNDETSIAYDELVIATGVRPRRLPGQHPDVYELRTLADCGRLGRAVRRYRRVVIVGAGFVGLEVAATARKLGAQVTVLEPLSDPLASRLGAHTAGRLLALHAEAGVEIRCGVAVESIAVSEQGEHSSVCGVLTDGGELVESPVVLVAIGCVPNVEWLEGSGLDLSDGVGCDAYCQAAPHVWAAGDVARWYHAGLGRALRIEHRMNASEQAASVAANIMGKRQPFVPVPFFWTDHYATKIQLAGVLPAEGDERFELGEGGEDAFARSFWVDGRLVGVIGWNAAKAIMPLRREIELSEPIRLKAALPPLPKGGTR